MAEKFRLAVSYQNRVSMTVRPELPYWLSPDRDMTNATYSGRVSYNYWSKPYWATPPWLTDEHIEQMRQIYLSASKMDHVDHIVPLKGQLVCGLHVPWNLQIIPAKHNLQKSNSYWPDMPFEQHCMLNDHNHEPHQMELTL